MLKEEPYLLADHWSRVLEDTYVSDCVPRRREPNKFSSGYTLLERG